MKTSTKLIVSTLLAAAPVVTMAAKNTITVWAWDPNFNISIMNDAIDRYHETHPDVKFKVVDFAKADVEQKLLTNLASGITKSLPDIVLIEDYNAQKYLQAFPGSFADLTDKVSYDDFAPYKVELMSVNGKVYGFPFDTGVTGLYYRKDILAEAGYTGDDLQNITWDRYIEIGKDVKAKTGINMAAFDANDSGLMRIMLNSSGKWFFDDKGKAQLQTPEMEAAVDAWKDVYQADILRITTGWGDWVSAFQQGNVATVITGVWITGSVKAAEDQAGLWGVAPVPRLDLPTSVNASNLGGSSWYVMNSSKVKDEAIDFMNATFAGDDKLYQDILVKNGAVGSYLPSQSSGSYAQADAFFDGQKIFLDFSQWMKEIPAVSFGMHTYEVSDILAAKMLDVISNKITVKEALKSAQAQANSQIQ